MTETPPTGKELAKKLVSMFLGDRLEDANEPPGLRRAVTERVAVRADSIRKRSQAQVDQLRSPSSKRLPDAYVADEENLENELQTGGAGIRTARALEGVISEPREFERGLARDLAPNAKWTLRSGASRVPRPSTRPSQLDWSLPPIPWIDSKTEWPPPGAAALDGVRQFTGTEGQPVRVTEAPYAGWVQLGMVERQETFASSHPTIPARRLIIEAGLIAHDGPTPTKTVPLSRGARDLWAEPEPYDRLAPDVDGEHARRVLAAAEGPLAALVDYGDHAGAPHRYRGIGLQRFTLVPRVEVIAVLDLQPETPALRHVLVDDHGPALVGRQWHGFLQHAGDYYPLEPAIHGADLLLRPDLFDILENTVGTNRLALSLLVKHSERSTSPEDPDGDD